MVLEAIKYQRGSLKILDQLKLPHKLTYVELFTCEDAWHAIQSMRVRGAPAIAIVAALGLAVELVHSKHQEDSQTVRNMIFGKLDYLVTSRPTAVNLAGAADKLKRLVSRAYDQPASNSRSVKDAYLEAAEQMLVLDVQDNKAIGRLGADWILNNAAAAQSDSVSVLTHCNTGSLATAGYGTALGVIRSLHAAGHLKHAYCTETRPYNQGSRLTAFELVHDNIPATLITDSMAAALFKLKRKHEKVVAVIVGADRVAANGDTANKIGTYALAISARFHGVKFLVAAPRTTIDMYTLGGGEIEIEQRPAKEMTSMKGPRIVDGQLDLVDPAETVSIAASGIDVWNPAFDVTPHDLIDGIVTEVGVVEKDASGKFNLQVIMDPNYRQSIP